MRFRVHIQERKHELSNLSIFQPLTNSNFLRFDQLLPWFMPFREGGTARSFIRSHAAMPVTRLSNNAMSVTRLSNDAISCFMNISGRSWVCCLKTRLILYEWCALQYNHWWLNGQTDRRYDSTDRQSRDAANDISLIFEREGGAWSRIHDYL